MEEWDIFENHTLTTTEQVMLKAHAHVSPRVVLNEPSFGRLSPPGTQSDVVLQDTGSAVYGI